MKMKLLYLMVIILSHQYKGITATCKYTDTSKMRMEKICHKKLSVRRYYTKCIDIPNGIVSERRFDCIETDIKTVYNEIHLHDSRYHKRIDAFVVFLKNSSVSVLIPESYDWKLVNSFHIQNTKTTKVIPGFFSSFSELENLEITDNELSKIDAGLFSNLKRLKSLVLSQNLISSLDEHSFYGLNYLEYIDLSNNKLSVLPQNIFQSNRLLSHVDISGNMLENIEIEFYQAADTSLSENTFKIIDLSDNKLKNIAINGSIFINELDLSKNKFRVFPSGLIIHVTKCNLSNNLIQSLDSIVSAESLEILDISYNNITKLGPETFKNIYNLINLNLSHNNINFLSIDTFTSCFRLEYLDLSYNNIYQLFHGHLNHLSNLGYLDISNNNMTFDLNILYTMNKLRILNIQNNNIQPFEKDVFDQFKLEEVSLSDNIANCRILASTVYYLQSLGIKVTSGQKTNVSNVLGYSCKNEDEKELKKEGLIIKKASNENEPDNNPDKNVNNISLNSSVLFKYLERIAQSLSKNDTVNVNEINKKLIKDLNETVTNTLFYKFGSVKNNNLLADYNGSNWFVNNNNILNYYLKYFEKNNKSIPDDIDFMNEFSDKALNLLNISLNEIKTRNSYKEANSTNLTSLNYSDFLQSIRNLSASLSSFKSGFQMNNNTKNKMVQPDALSETSCRNTTSENKLVFDPLLLILVILCCSLIIILIYIYKRFVYNPKKLCNASKPTEEVKLV